MPNIEIHGFGTQAPISVSVYGVQLKDPAFSLRARIFAMFKDKPYFNDMVVTIVPDETVDKLNFHQPFLRVVSTPVPYIGEIIELLKTLNMDIEIQELTAFIPKKE